MKFTLTNRKQVEHTFQVAGSYKRITLLAGESVTLEGKEKDYAYYRSRGLKVSTDSSGSRIATVKESTKTQATPEVVEELAPDVVEEPVISEETDFFDDEGVLTDDENLSAESIYTFEFLTKKKAIAVLEARGIAFDDSLNTKELKDLVIESNPS